MCKAAFVVILWKYTQVYMLELLDSIGFQELCIKSSFQPQN